MEFVAGDIKKASLKARGLTFEAILSAPTLAFIPNPSHEGQMLLIVEIDHYAVAAACEKIADEPQTWRIITAFPSRKYTKHYLK